MVSHERPPGNPDGVRDLARWCRQAEAFLREMSSRIEAAVVDIRGADLALRGSYVVALEEDTAGVARTLGQLADRYRMVSDACAIYANVLEETQMAWGRAADGFELFDRDIRSARADLLEAGGEALVGMALPLILPKAATDAVSAKRRYESAKFEADALDWEAGRARERWATAEAECASVIRGSFTSDALAADEKERKAKQLADFDLLFAQLRRCSPGQVGVWWEGLGPAQRATLLDHRPGELCGLSGLPPGVVQEAQRRYFMSVAQDVPVAKKEASLEALVKLEVARIPVAFGGSIAVVETRYADGHVTLELSVDTLGGLSMEQAKLLASSGVNGTFRFANQSEAKEFVSGFLNALKPTLGDLVPGPSDFLTGGPNPVHLLIRSEVENIVGYLGSQRDHLDVIGWGSGSRVLLDSRGVDGPEVGGELSGGARFEIADLSEDAKEAGGTPHVELKARLEGKADVSFNAGRLSGHVAFESSLSFHCSTPQKLRLSLEGDRVTLPGVYGSALELGGGGGVGAKVQLELDLTDPRNRRVIAQIMPALRSSDLVGVMRALNGTWDRTAVVVQGTRIEQPADIGVDVKGVEVGGSACVSTAVVTMVKPPGGRLFQVDAMDRGGESW